MLRHTAFRRVRTELPHAVSERDKARAVGHYEEIASRYEEVVGAGVVAGWMRHRERSAVLRMMALASGARTMIDVGCGGGFYSLAAKRAGLRVVAADIAPGMVAAIRSRVDEAVVLDIENEALPSTFDIVLCSGVLDFLVEPEKGLGNLARMVAPAGCLVLHVPRAGPGSWFYRTEKALRLGINVNFFSTDWIARVARGYGMQIERVEYPLPFNMSIRLEPVQESCG